MQRLYFRRMRLLKRTAAALITLTCALAAGQQSESPPAVQMRHCSMKPGRPPLKYLSFDVTLRNSSAAPQWFLFPSSLYGQPHAARTNAGIDAIELFSDPSGSVTVVHFLGTMSLQPEGAGGFKGVLLPPNGSVSIHGFGISFGGEPASMPVRVVIARRISIGGVEVQQWLGRSALSADSADIKELVRARGSKSTPDSKELPVAIEESSEFTIADALQQPCSP